MFALTYVALLATGLLAVSAQHTASHGASHTCPKTNIVSVTGAGRRTYNTSIAVFSLGVSAEAKTAIATQKILANKSTSLFAFLRAQKVQKLETTGVNLYERRNYSSGGSKIIGYGGSNTVTFEIAVDNAGVILDGAVRNGASNINGVSFKATPEVTAAAREEALRDAAKNAKREATTIVTALGRNLGNPVEAKITDSFVPQGTPSSFARREFAAVPAAPASKARPTSKITSGERSVTAYVSISFAIW